MGFTVEYESSVTAPRMFKAAVLDWHNLGPKVAPNIVASGSLVQGTGGIGTVRQINFTEGLFLVGHGSARLIRGFVVAHVVATSKGKVKGSAHREGCLEPSRWFRGAGCFARRLQPTTHPQNEKNRGEGSGVRMAQGVMPFSYVKERLDFVDEGNLEATCTIIEGGHLTTMLDSATAHYNFRQTDTGGCVCKVVTETRTKAGVGARISDEEAKAKDGLKKQFKATETYLLDHPDVYA